MRILRNRTKLFCNLSPACYKISRQKEICKRHIQNFFSHEKFAKEIRADKLPVLVFEYSSHLIKTGVGIDPQLQQNKAVNIQLAGSKINGIVLHPGEVFSFYKVVGKSTEREGYKKGRIIERGAIKPGLGGGLCNLGNTLHQLALHSPLEITECHYHSDALAPDEGERVPFSSGTAVCYNNLDYRFKNNTSQLVQLLVWCQNGFLHGQLRCEQPFPNTYRLTEEGHHFRKEGSKYYRVSKIFKETIDRKTEKVIKKELIRDNHSEVMFDAALLPREQIQECARTDF